MSVKYFGFKLFRRLSSAALPRLDRTILLSVKQIHPDIPVACGDAVAILLKGRELKSSFSYGFETRFLSVQLQTNTSINNPVIFDLISLSIRKRDGWRKGEWLSVCGIRHLPALLAACLPSWKRGIPSSPAPAFKFTCFGSLLQAPEDWSLEISWYPSVTPRSLLPKPDLPDPPRLQDKARMTGREMQERRQQPERDIKASQNTFCISALPPGLCQHERLQMLPL